MTIPAQATPDPSHTSALLRLLDQPVSPEDLAAGARAAANPSEARQSGSAGIVLFALGEETLAVPAKLLRRVTPVTSPIRIPHRTSGVLRGLCNIRGELVLCADLRHLLGMPAQANAEAPTESGSRRMVVIGPTDAPWAFEVDSLKGVERIDPTNLMDAPLTVEHAIGAFVAGLVEIEGTRVTVLDGERVLAGFKAGLA